MLLWWHNPRHLPLRQRVVFWLVAPWWWLGLWPVAVLWQVVRLARKMVQVYVLGGGANPPLPPMLLIGNIVVGGGGKTPVVQMVQRHFPRSVTLVKNYRAPWRWRGGAVLLEKNSFKKSKEGVMDEARLHTAGGDVVLCKNRRAGLALITKLQKTKGYRLIIADDGFEDYSFTPTMTLLTLQGDFGLGNGLPLPLGPLRQLLFFALRNRQRPPAGLLLLVDGQAGSYQKKLYQKLTASGLPVFLLAKDYQPPFKAGARLVAFAGIARPSSFFATLSRLGGQVVATKKLFDHQPITPVMIKKWQGLADRHGARLITTEKDRARLAPAVADSILTLPMLVKPDKKIIDFISKTLYHKKMKKVEKDWRSILPPDVYHITREKGTERAFTGHYNDNKQKGMYNCRCCGAPLFSSTDKFDSGTGWPSFTQPSKEDMVAEAPDHSFFMKRTEVLCKACDAHLGHVFPDGPAPTGLRYCINSASLDFKKK